MGAFVIRSDFLSNNTLMRFVNITKVMLAKPTKVMLDAEIVIDLAQADGFLVEYAYKMSQTRRLHRQVLLIHQ